MFNKIILVGFLTRDPELRYTPQGTAVATIGMAANSKVKVGDEWKDEVLFINVVIFGRRAETCSEYLNKGSGVIVDGRLRERKWESEGQQKSKFEIVAQDIQFLPKKQGSGRTNFEDNSLPPEETTDIEPF
ncbi:MAG: single-stranded DNA-binding protein [Candidatus Magnetoovum sp. WYHC-5]|nr:single-stranded DNA-binding protein [Candidatus Magnetoovum sp. WYHC-5]